MRTYVSSLSMTYQCHNKAEKEALRLAKDLNRKVLLPDEVIGFKNEFREGIEIINRNNPRCKDLILEITDYDKNGDITFRLAQGIFVLHLFWGEL